MLRKQFLSTFCLALIKEVVQILLKSVFHLFKHCKVVVVLGFYLIGLLGGILIWFVLVFFLTFVRLI